MNLAFHSPPPDLRSSFCIPIMHTLHAPWRLEYIRSLETKDFGPTCGCFLCDARATDLSDRDLCRKRLVLWHSEHSVCVINRYPYTSGHLMIAPQAHKADLEDLSAEELCDLNLQTVRAVKLLRKAFKPQGFNIGINMGHAAGAGLPGHLHQHIIARWAGDTNFISVVGGLRIVPYDMQTLWEELAGAV
jgi:ATP adenylyltransferase